MTRALARRIARRVLAELVERPEGDALRDVDRDDLVEDLADAIEAAAGEHLAAAADRTRTRTRSRR